MSPLPMKILCRYQYDPLDRLVGLKPLENPGTTQRFYQEDELVNEIEGQSQLTIMRHGPQPLAQRSGVASTTETTLLATDQQHSLLKTLTNMHSQQMAYTAYGYRSSESGLSSLLGFNGERPDSITGHYLLGQGNRAFNPVLMRFNSPDALSPFGDGGINAYAYCGNDPINRYDPSGNSPVAKLLLTRWKQSVPKPTPNTVPLTISKTSQVTDKNLKTAWLQAENELTFSIQIAGFEEKVIVPYEKVAQGVEQPAESLSRQGRSRRKYRGIALALDQRVREKLKVLAAVDINSLNEYHQAQKKLNAAMSDKAPVKQRRATRTPYREARLKLKSNLSPTTEESVQEIRTD